MKRCIFKPIFCQVLFAAQQLLSKQVPYSDPEKLGKSLVDLKVRRENLKTGF